MTSPWAVGMGGGGGGRQGEAKWEAMKLVSCSLELETKIFPRLRVSWDRIVGVPQVEFHHVIALA